MGGVTNYILIKEKVGFSNFRTLPPYVLNYLRFKIYFYLALFQIVCKVDSTR